MADIKDLVERFKKFLTVTDEEKKEALEGINYPSATDIQRNSEILALDISLHRKKFLKDYPLNQREMMYFCSTVAVFLISGGVFTRVRKTIVFSFVGGIFLIPEYFRPYI